MKPRILIVDDDQLNRDVLSKLLRKDYELAIADSGEDGLDLMKEFGPELVILDVMMPGVDGYEVCRKIKSAPHGELTHVVLVSGRASSHERNTGYAAGADDYLVKPFDHDELLAKVRIQFKLRGVLLSLARANSEIELRNSQLERLVRQRTAEVVATKDVTVFALAKLAESRDPETGEHLERLRDYSQILAQRLGREGPYANEINDRFLEHLYRSSPLHDIGKVGIPDAILLKPGSLSDDEFEIMKRHTLIGAQALADAAAHTDSGGFLKMAVDIAWHHHERFSGGGYPDGLTGSRIPLAARIVALADVYDALTSVRVYKSAFAPELAKSMIEQEEGKHFDPAVVEAFRACYEDFCGFRTPAEAPIASLRS